jgi:aspartyl protease family protein
MKMTRYFMVVASAWLTLAATAHATDVEISALFNGKAMLSINRGSPRVIAVGQTIEGVKLLSANSSGAVLEIDGKKRTLNLGQAISTAQVVGSRPTVKLEADGGGHFVAYGSVNGRPIKFLVDTGATSIALSSAQARAMGIDLDRAQRGAVTTASGHVRSYNVVLDNVKVGDISLNLVEAVIIDSMPGDTALLGNSFLSRLEMKREGTVLTLTKNY